MGADLPPSPLPLYDPRSVCLSDSIYDIQDGMSYQLTLAKFGGWVRKDFGLDRRGHAKSHTREGGGTHTHTR